MTMNKSFNFYLKYYLASLNSKDHEHHLWTLTNISFNQLQLNLFKSIAVNTARLLFSFPRWRITSSLCVTSPQSCILKRLQANERRNETSKLKYGIKNRCEDGEGRRKKIASRAATFHSKFSCVTSPWNFFPSQFKNQTHETSLSFFSFFSSRSA